MARRNKTNKGQQQVREWSAWKLKGMGFTDQQIADQMGLDRTTVSKMLARVRARALPELREEAVQHKLQVSEQLQYMIAEALSAWRASKQPVKQAQSTKRRAPNPAPGSTSGPLLEMGQVDTVSTQDRADGNVAYLDAAGRAMDRLTRLWGLEGPVAVAMQVAGPGGGPIPVRQQLDVNLLDLEPPQLAEHMQGLVDVAQLLIGGTLTPPPEVIDVTPPSEPESQDEPS